MLCFWKVVICLYILDNYAECLYPGSLSVRKLNRQMVARKRQNTLELCTMFSVENEKTQEHLQRHKRAKRSAEPLKDHNERIESIVDKLYDEEEQQGGEKVAYRRMVVNTTTTTTTTASPEEKSGRRFDFAPEILKVDLEGGEEETGKYEDKNVPVTWHKYWKHGIIPYFIDPNTYDTFLAEKITKAFDDFELSTCIRLQRLREKPTDKPSLQEVQWLYITNPSGTRQCVHSNEMKSNSGVQWVVFGYDCMSEGEILHEVMHILGFSHEHIREDRDKYIGVMWDNIKPGYKKFFEIKQRPPILSSLPYDYYSVLHYPPRAFSKNGKYTLVAEAGVGFGQREGLSDIDLEKVSMIYGGECIERNKQYLITTCPTVIASKTNKKPEKPTQEEINDYFKDRLWPYGIINYKLKDKIEFSIEERQNIEEVIKHIEKETCIEFRNLSEDDEEDVTATTEATAEIADDGNRITVQSTDIQSAESDINTVGTGNENELTNDDRKTASDSNLADLTGTDTQSKRRTADSIKKRKERSNFPGGPPLSPSRRHADDILVLTRSPAVGCACPPPGRPNEQKELVINSDCFNSVNDLLHVFVHVLGLDHQHNMYDRDEFLAINWTNIHDSLEEELKDKLPPAASVGFAYDYQSVMHFPWLDIKNGVTSIMYPIWNDGWAMGHWQGLSSVDVQKLNMLYFEQCQARKKHIARIG